MTSTSIQTIDAADLMRRACERNVSAELHYHEAGGTFVAARVRLLGLSDDRLYADRPQRAGGTVSLRARQKLEGYFVLAGRRYRFETRLQDPRILFSLNERCRVPGIALDPPTRVDEQQRRRDYRVQISEEHVIPVHMVVVDPRFPNACPVPAVRARGELVDISGGGISVEGPLPDLRHVRPNDRFYATLALPEAERALSLLLSVRHAVSIRPRGVCRLGCAIETWPGAGGRADTRVILRFVTQEQRRLLAKWRR